MSLMDDVFDVRAKLKGTPEADLFETIENALWSYENQLDHANAKLKIYQDFFDMVKENTVEKS